MPSPVRRPCNLNDPLRKNDAARLEPKTPASRSTEDRSFDELRNQRTECKVEIAHTNFNISFFTLLPMPPKRLTEFLSELELDSGKNVLSLCFGVRLG